MISNRYPDPLEEFEIEMSTGHKITTGGFESAGSLLHCIKREWSLAGKENEYVGITADVYDFILNRRVSREIVLINPDHIIHINDRRTEAE